MIWQTSSRDPIYWPRKHASLNPWTIIVYMYMHTYTYIYVCICIYIYINTYLWTYMYINQYELRDIIKGSNSWTAKTREFVPWTIYVYIYIYIYICIYICLCTYIQKVYINIYMYKYIWAERHHQEVQSVDCENARDRILGLYMYLHTHIYSHLQIVWHRILRLFLKLFQRTNILPMGSTISTG